MGLLSSSNHLFFFGVATASTLCPARGSFDHHDFFRFRDGGKRADPGRKAISRRTAGWISVIKLPINGISRSRGGYEFGCVGRAWVLLKIEQRPIGPGEQ